VSATEAFSTALFFTSVHDWIIDNLFYPAKVNLAMSYNQEGNNNGAENLLHEVVRHHPEICEVHYSLGLLLADKSNMKKSRII
jgi:Tfp pilus assembly protein PilF